MTDAIWIVARSTGTAALVALALSVLSGLALRSGALGWLSHNRGVRAVHDLTSLLWIPLVVAHIVALALDPYARIGLADLVVPFQVPYARLAIGLGTVATQLAFVVLVSTAVRARLSRAAWLALHRLSYVAFVAAFAHGLLAGTDFAQPVIAALAWATAAALALAGIGRLTTRGGQSPARSRMVEIP